MFESNLALENLLQPPPIEIKEKMTKYGGWLILLDCPEGLEVGLDYTMFAVGPMFCGFRMIPPGPHYFYWNTGGIDYGVDLSRTGQFLHFEYSQVYTFSWDESEEVFLPVTEDESGRYEANVHADFTPRTGVYNYKYVENWEEMTFKLSKGVLRKIEPIARFVHSRSAEYDDFNKNSADSNIETFNEKTSLALNGDLFFSEIPRPSSTKVSGPDLTAAYLDRSESLDELIRQNEKSGFLENQTKGEDFLIGELQFAYIAFLLGQNWVAFEQWKNLTILLSKCEKSVGKYPNMYADFIRTLVIQIEQTPSDLTTDSVLKNNFLIHSIKSLDEIIRTSTQPSKKLRNRMNILMGVVQKKFGVSPDQIGESDEEGPVVVDEGEFISFEE